MEMNCQRHRWSPESLQDKGRSGCVWSARCVRKHARTFSMTSESRASGEIGDGVHQMRQMHGYLPQRSYRLSSHRNRDRRSSHIRRTENSQTNGLSNIHPEAPPSPPRMNSGASAEGGRMRGWAREDVGWAIGDRGMRAAYI